MRPNCAEMLYIVQENDTLEGIAYQFATSREELMAANHMETAMVKTDMELIVPVCNLTPTGTIHPTLLITTYTPSTRPATSTPDG
jgi:LysM repeat protein